MLVVKALLAPTFVVGASLTARRFGPWIGGVVGGLPVRGGRSCSPTRSFTARSCAACAAGTLLGLLSLTAFVIIYGRLASRAGWIVCMLCAGWAAFAVATLVLDGVTVPAGVALALACTGFVVALLLLPSAEQ